MAGGGSVTLTGVHGFDLLRWLIGVDPERVSARTRSLLGHPFENLFDARFEYADRPLIASCEVAKISASRSGVVELVGTQGQIWVDWLAGRVEWLGGRERRVIADPGDQPSIPPTLEAFCRWVREGGSCPVPVSDGIATLRMADACYRSDRLGGAPVRPACLPVSPRAEGCIGAWGHGGTASVPQILDALIQRLFGFSTSSRSRHGHWASSSSAPALPQPWLSGLTDNPQWEFPHAGLAFYRGNAVGTDDL